MNVLHLPAFLFGLALVFSSAVAAPPEKFGFKGIELGSGSATVASNPRYECHTARTPAADTICSLRAQEKETIAGAPIKSLFFFYYDGKLTGITIHLEEKHFVQVTKALRSKYGDGRVQTELIRNLKGVTFENQSYTWKTTSETLLAQRYSGRLDQSSIRFSADELIQRIEQRRSILDRDPSKDL